MSAFNTLWVENRPYFSSFLYPYVCFLHSMGRKSTLFFFVSLPICLLFTIYGQKIDLIFLRFSTHMSAFDTLWVENRPYFSSFLYPYVCFLHSMGRKSVFWLVYSLFSIQKYFAESFVIVCQPIPLRHWFLNNRSGTIEYFFPCVIQKSRCATPCSRQTSPAATSAWTAFAPIARHAPGKPRLWRRLPGRHSPYAVKSKGMLL